MTGFGALVIEDAPHPIASCYDIWLFVVAWLIGPAPRPRDALMQNLSKGSLMLVRFLRIRLAVLTAAVLASSGVAHAQQRRLTPPKAVSHGQPSPQNPVDAALVAVQADWTKVCGADPKTKKEVCYTTRDFGAKPDQPLLALAVYEIKGEDQKIIRLLLPPGLMLKPGFRFGVDKNRLESGAFEICFPNGCFAEAKIKRAIVDGFKKSEKLTVVVKNQVGNEVDFSLPLAGFGQAFDGPPIDPKILEEQQRKLQEELQKKAEEERKKHDTRESAAPAPGQK